MTVTTADLDALRANARVFYLAIALTNQRIAVTSCQRKPADAGAGTHEWVWRLETSRGRYDVPASVVASNGLDVIVTAMVQRGLYWQAAPKLEPVRR